MRRLIRNGFVPSGGDLIHTLTVPQDVTINYGITNLGVIFDALGTTKTMTTVITFIDTPPADTWDADGLGIQLAGNVIQTGTPHVAGVSTYAEVFTTEENFVDFYNEFLNDQVIQFGVAAEL